MGPGTSGLTQEANGWRERKTHFISKEAVICQRALNILNVRSNCEILYYLPILQIVQMRITHVSKRAWINDALKHWKAAVNPCTGNSSQKQHTLVQSLQGFSTYTDLMCTSTNPSKSSPAAGNSVCSSKSFQNYSPLRYFSKTDWKRISLQNPSHCSLSDRLLVTSS